MAGNTRGQTNLRDQANPPQTQPDNIAIMAQLLRVTGKMDAMRSDLGTITAAVEALKATSRSPTPTPQTTTSQTPPQAIQSAT